LDSDEFDERYEKLIELHAKLVTGLSAIEGVSVYGGQTESVTPTVSFNIGDLDCQTAGMLLDSQFEIECRTGLHCAPLIHEPIGSAIHGGTVRFSPGLFTTPQEIQSALDAVEQLVSLSGDAQ
jgi:selenocysteine lyase/cysteine desulfurase